MRVGFSYLKLSSMFFLNGRGLAFSAWAMKLDVIISLRVSCSSAMTYFLYVLTFAQIFADLDPALQGTHKYLRVEVELYKQCLSKVLNPMNVLRKVVVKHQ
jgi:hypothetical protein